MYVSVQKIEKKEWMFNSFIALLFNESVISARIKNRWNVTCEIIFRQVFTKMPLSS